MKKTTRSLKNLLCVSAFLSAFTLTAQQTINWSVVQLTDGTEVLTEGTLIEALNFSGGDTAATHDTSINGVTFSGFVSGAASGNAFENPTATNFSSNSQNVVPFTVDQYNEEDAMEGLAIYDELLSRFLWNSTGGATVTISGLEIGKSYKIQFFNADERVNEADAFIQITIQGGATYGDDSTTKFADNAGMVINGEFVAVATSVVLDMVKDNFGVLGFHLNAYQLREVASLGLEDKVLGSFNMFPNPATDRLNISLDQIFSNTRVSISSVTGQLVQSQVINKRNSEIDISTLKSGLYLVQVESDRASITKKLIVE